MIEDVHFEILQRRDFFPLNYQESEILIGMTIEQENTMSKELHKSFC